MNGIINGTNEMIAPAGNGQKVEQARVSTLPSTCGEGGSGPNRGILPANQSTDPIFVGENSSVGERPLADKSGVVIPDQQTDGLILAQPDSIGKIKEEIKEAIREGNVSEGTILLLIQGMKYTMGARDKTIKSSSMKEILDLFFKIQEAGLAPDVLATTDGDSRSIFSYIFENLNLMPDAYRGQIAIRVFGILKTIDTQDANDKSGQASLLEKMFAGADFLIPRLILNNLEYVETQEDRKNILRGIIDMIEKLNPDARRTILIRIDFDGKFFAGRQFLHYLVALGDYERKIQEPWLDPIINDSLFLLSLLDKIASFEPQSLGEKIKSMGGGTVFTHKPLGGRGFINTGKFWEMRSDLMAKEGGWSTEITDNGIVSKFPNLVECIPPEIRDTGRMRRRVVF